MLRAGQRFLGQPDGGENPERDHQPIGAQLQIA
jgi:hypothetical protein